ncbi:MFS antiporter QDR3-like protein 2 [Colletotrichum chlorophyti]|uniref:MFS antiporter QDR3-like protein 2 n=1 Tax=Colletotrichum chlorophyti TaxID=708187 RepID=A0A1Q8RNW3_9PEZI|nr:MFS antiporter QDR3-like protein 2 [Colletotrichum chlorophyti]
MTTTSRDPEKDPFPPENATNAARREDGQSQTSDSEDEITEADRYGDRSRQSSSPDHNLDEDPSTGRDDTAPARTRSRASSSRSRALLVVSRSKRRGLFAQLAAIPEVENPYDYTNKTKWTITLIIALAAAVSPMGSSIFYQSTLVDT